MATSASKNAESKLPRLGNTARSVRRYLAAVASGVEAGSITPNQAKEITSAAKGVLRAVEMESKRSELDELRALVERAESVAKLGEDHEVDARTSMDKADADVQ